MSGIELAYMPTAICLGVRYRVPDTDLACGATSCGTDLVYGTTIRGTDLLYGPTSCGTNPLCMLLPAADRRYPRRDA
eukprot:3116768-Rhodomonas_salina.2